MAAGGRVADPLRNRLVFRPGIITEIVEESRAVNPGLLARVDASMAAQHFFGCEQNVIMVRSAEERAEAEDMARQFKKRQEEARGAEQRALALLHERLGPRDAALFARTHTLMRPSRLWPGVEYLIPDGGYEMVRVIRDGREQTRLCVVAGQGEPWPDRTMTILDLLESGQERRLWEMANVFPRDVTSRELRAPMVPNVEGPPRTPHELSPKAKAQLVFILAIPVLIVLGAILVGIFG